jgi:hypothetical protein
MASRSAEQSIETTTAYVEKLAEIAKNNADILTKSGNATTTALASLSEAYQAMFTRNGKMVTEAITALSAAKTPTDFYDLQRKLIEERFEAAAADARAIAELTASVFVAAFEPVQKQVAVIPDIVKTVARLPWPAPRLVG